MSVSYSILILSPDVITERMAGPAIRYWEFAKALASHSSVTLAAPNTIADILPQKQSISLVQHTPDNIVELVNQHDIIIFQGYILDYYPILRQTDKILVADLYDPVPLEGLEQYHNSQQEDLQVIADQIRMMNDQLMLADYFLCASERQRDLWLGHLLALRRINSFTYQEIQQRVLTVPFGLPDEPPQPSEQKLFGESAEFILLWGGGIWEWFDPLTVIRAVHRLLPHYPNLKLVFLGTEHPNPNISPMPKQHQAKALAQELGLYDSHVIFQSGWVPYEMLSHYLLEAHVGVSAHLQTLESHFSFRTRLLYYLWAGKPIITTQGDVLAEQIAHYQAGIVVPPNDEKAWIAAIEKLYNPQYYATYLRGVKTLAQNYYWSKTTQPLQDLCVRSSRAPDLFIQEGLRKSLYWDCERAYNTLKFQTVEMEQQLQIMENSNSWRMTAPLRTLRRWLTQWKKV